MNTNYLNEEKYQNNKKKISKASIFVLIIGLLFGASLIILGVINKNEVDNKYSEENKQKEIAKIESEIETEKTTLMNKKTELETKGIQYSAFTTYTDGESYDLKIITNVMDPSFNHCAFDEYKNNGITKKYCSLKNELKETENMNINFERNFNSFGSTALFMFGIFIIIATFMISGFIYMIAKRREIAAFTTQQMMPIAKEGLEKMGPTLKNMAKDVAPTMSEIAKDMAPTYGEIAKEITKGVKEGLKDDNK